MSPRRLFVFDQYRLDAQERQLLRAAQVVPLPPKLFDLLAALVEHPGRLLEKQDLLDKVWSDVAVEEGSLARGISSLRRVLGSTPDGQDYIQTVAKRGYRFTSQVRETSEEEPHPARSAIPLPPPLAAPAPIDFVGREAELAQMHFVWQQATLGRQQLLLVAGEPGIGKTRLALEFARARGAEGATILVGCSDEETLVPYQPFIESLTWYIRHCPDAELRAQLAASGGGADLGAFVPELRTRIPDLRAPATVDPEGQRYRLFEAIGGMLAAASRARPMLLVFDDLHWADKPTLLLLRHVMRSARAASLATFATYRESELGRTHPLAEILATLRREPGVSRLVLHGLGLAHVGALVSSVIGPGAPAQLPRAVAESTDGNPFFATEMLRHLKETGAIDRVGGPATVADLGLSEGIKDVIGRRLSRLSDACNRALTVGAVIGREFDVALLEAVADLPDSDLLDGLEEAMRAQLVVESTDVAGRFAFSHALIRETVYSELSSPRRMRLHRRVADAIERLAKDVANPPFAELAYHFSQAASTGAADKAIDYATRAGTRAADGLAHEEAVRLLDIALHLLELRPADPETVRLRVDLHARRARSFEALGQWTSEVRDLEAALAHLDPPQIERRCELLLALARAWFLRLDVRPVERYATEALQLAERLPRADLAADAIAWLGRCRQADGDLEAAIDLDRRSMARAPGEMTAAHMMGPLTLYLAGRSTQALAQAAAATDAARSSRDTTYTMYVLSHLGLNLTATGRYADAARTFREARSFGRTFGALPMLARATAMAAGFHLAVFDFDGAEALQAEACELARGVGFVPSIVSAGIDSLLTFARRREPGRAERLLDETAAAAASTAGWHQWLWQLRLSQARAELALARDAADEAIAAATDCIERSRTTGRPKYEALGLMTRSRALRARAQTRKAIADAKAAASVATKTADPALVLVALDTLIELEGTDALAAQARAAAERIHDALPDAAMRRSFTESDVVRRVVGPRPRWAGA